VGLSQYDGVVLIDAASRPPHRVPRCPHAFPAEPLLTFFPFIDFRLCWLGANYWNEQLPCSRIFSGFLLMRFLLLPFAVRGIIECAGDDVLHDQLVKFCHGHPRCAGISGCYTVLRIIKCTGDNFHHRQLVNFSDGHPTSLCESVLLWRLNSEARLC